MIDYVFLELLIKRWYFAGISNGTQSIKEVLFVSIDKVIARIALLLLHRGYTMNTAACQVLLYLHHIPLPWLLFLGCS